MQTQNTQSVKHAKDIRLEGIAAEMVIQDSAIARVILRDGVGNFVEFHRSAYDGVKAFVAAPPKMQKAHRITAKLAGIAVSEDYSSKYTAESRASSLRNCGAENVTCETVEVPEEAQLLEDEPV